MKIGEVVKQPPTNKFQSGKYKELWDAVATLANGDWLTVATENSVECLRIYMACRTKRFAVRKDGTTLYISKPSLPPQG